MPGRDTGGTGGVVSGKVAIDFAVNAPDSFCTECGFRRIDVLDSNGRALPLLTGCALDCDTCSTSVDTCHSIVCGPSTVVTGSALVWDGIVLEPGACGAGTPCLRKTPANPGTYTAVLCLSPGMVSAEADSPHRCVSTGPEQCGRVDFDYPGTATVHGVVAP